MNYVILRKVQWQVIEENINLYFFSFAMENWQQMVLPGIAKKKKARVHLSRAFYQLISLWIIKLPPLNRRDVPEIF
jgi:hypothetical protein